MKTDKQMTSKFRRFLQKSASEKITAIRAKAKYFLAFSLTLMVKPYSVAFRLFLKTLWKTKLGRDFLYSSVPKDTLTIATTIDNVRYVLNPADQTIGRYVFREKRSFDSQLLEKSLEIIGSRKRILFDVGANIGTIGIHAVSSGLIDHCIAFEPEPNNFKLLRSNVVLNDLQSQFSLHNIALTNSGKEEVTFELSPTNLGDHRIRTRNTVGRLDEHLRKTIQVETATLDDFCEQLRLDECVLFMDTQGFEGHVLAGGKKILNASVPIVTEFWPYGLNRAGGMDLFCRVFDAPYYNTIYDLKRPGKKFKFNPKAISNIAEEIGVEYGYTDLLFINE